MRLFGRSISSSDTLDPQLKEALEGLVGHIQDSIEFSMLLGSCHMVWETADALVAFCPDFDHVLFMLNDHEAGRSDAGMIALTREVLDDLEQKLLPAFRAQQDLVYAMRREDHGNDVDRFILSARMAVNGELVDGEELPKARKLDFTKLKQLTDDAVARVRSFAERWPHDAPSEDAG